MQINWFTVIAQLVNFFILVWLLKRFLYKPVLSAIEEREKRIKDQLEDAEAKKAEALKQGNDFNKKWQDFDTQRKALMAKAVEESNAERERMLEEARQEAVKLRINLEKASKEERENRTRELIRMTQKEVFAIVGKTISDLASSSLEEESVKTFVSRIRQASDPQRRKFLDAFHSSSSSSLIIKSAFDLPQLQRQEIERAVQEILKSGAVFQYETVPELVSGIEIAAGGYKLSWNISGYLASMERAFSNGISETAKSGITEGPEKGEELHG